ncbi:MAG TPA: hypothetical protein VEA58_00630 [Anaerovoracaceae bacterium]|nr:hypothetical protein [Anaerovoracaceae bacterium]
MQRLSLCIDIDGTVTDPYYWIPKANKFFKRNVKPEDVTSYDMHEVLGVEEKEYEEFYSVFGTTLHKEAEIRSGVHEVINEFYKTHYIHFVTAREEKMESVSLDWLYEHQIPFDSISLLGSHDKVKRAGELESDFFIEDRYSNALQLARAGFDVLLIDCSYNQGPLLPNITRVRSWSDIKQIITEHAREEAS